MYYLLENGEIFTHGQMNKFHTVFYDDGIYVYQNKNFIGAGGMGDKIIAYDKSLAVLQGIKRMVENNDLLIKRWTNY